MNRFVIASHRGLLERLGKGRVGVARAADILSGGAVLNRKDALRNKLARVGAHNVNSQNAISFGVSEHLFK